MTEPETAADAAIQAASPALWEALSPLGRRLRLPANFLPEQTAEARGKAFNATIGQITDGRGKAVPLPVMAAALEGLDDAARSQAFLYSPVEGLAELRRRWREHQRRGRPPGLPSSLPIVTAGPIQALSLAADLFAAPGRTVTLSASCPESYPEIFGLRTEARLLALAELAQLPADEPALAVLRGPAGEGERTALLAAAERRPLVVVVDDSGLEAEGAEGDGSLFWDLLGAHPNLVPIKVDGAGFPGIRLGFLTLPFDPDTAIAKALEAKIKLLLRAVVGSPSATSQVLLLRMLSD